MHIGGEMRETTIRTLLLFTACFAAMHATAQRDLPELNTNPGTLSLVEFQRLFEASKRWGEFGDDDQLGSLNLITPQTRVQAASLKESGISVSLANPLSKTVEGNFI